ncbi:MAG: hypothetical protein IKN54_01895 [Lachnospiraceae bacterium]|nr:hypothetical protein [Lachnospiraceae bacterium]
MVKSKNVFLFVALIIGVGICGLLMVLYLNGFFYKPTSQQLKEMNRLIAENSVIYYYGNMDPGKEITVPCEKVSEFTEESIGDIEEKYDYHAIVIIDFDGSMNLSEAELKLAKTYCEEKHYDLLYYGTDNYETFKKCDYFTQFNGSNMGFVYNGSYWMNRDKEEADNYLNPYLLTGNWNIDNEKSFGHRNKHLFWKFIISYIDTLLDDTKEQSVK